MPKPVFCPKGHICAFTLAHDNHSCDVCPTKRGHRTGFFACKPCGWDRCVWACLTKEGHEKTKAGRAPVYCPSHFNGKKVACTYYPVMQNFRCTSCGTSCSGCGAWQCPSCGHNTTICTAHCAPWDASGNDLQPVDKPMLDALMNYFVGLENSNDPYEKRKAREQSHAELALFPDFKLFCEGWVKKEYKDDQEFLWREGEEVNALYFRLLNWNCKGRALQFWNDSDSSYRALEGRFNEWTQNITHASGADLSAFVEDGAAAGAETVARPRHADSCVVQQHDHSNQNTLTLFVLPWSAFLAKKPEHRAMIAKLHTDAHRTAVTQREKIVRLVDWQMHTATATDTAADKENRVRLMKLFDAYHASLPKDDAQHGSKAVRCAFMWGWSLDYADHDHSKSQHPVRRGGIATMAVQRAGDPYTRLSSWWFTQDWTGSHSGEEWQPAHLARNNTSESMRFDPKSL
jgi:hypothetical protein